MKVRLLGPDDVALLEEAPPGVFDRPVRSELAREFLEDPRHHLAAAIHEGRIVGFASAVHYVHPDKDPEIWINEVAVAPTHRGRGVGKRLLLTLLEVAARLDCRGAWVLTRSDNPEAPLLFASLGGIRASTDSIMFSFAVGPADDEDLTPEV
jgi:ribosomal protein S18 acetylase RimI-like enzyme